MNLDSFKELEALFHEFAALSLIDRAHRLQELNQTDSAKANTLRSMFASITHDPDFLDPIAIEAMVETPVEIPIDGSVTLADRYTILQCIGTGGSSTVFRAKATNPDRDVALKMLRFGLSSQRARDRFNEESKALATLTHPHIAHVYETGMHDQDAVRVPWIAMELVHGSQTITEFIKANDLSLKQRTELFIQVCGAINAAHQSGVLHLDINASNILIDAHGYPKIIDFGLAGLMYSSTQSKNPTFVGTRTSMAPEQTLFLSTPFNEQTDIYALGLIFVEILTGTQLQAFPGQPDQQARKHIAMGKAREIFRELKDFPDQHRPLVDSMLRVDPNERPSKVGILLEQLCAPPPPSKKHILPKVAAAALVGTIGFTSWYVIANPTNPKTSPDLPAVNTHIQAQTNDLVLPTDLAVEITSENPRQNKFSPNHARVIEGISMALESSVQMEPLRAADLHTTLADNYRIGGGYEDSINHYQQAITLLQEHGTTNDLNWTLLSQTDLLLFLGRTDQAQSALAQINRTGKLEPLFLLNLGIAETQIHIALGESNSALRQIQYTATLLGSVPSENHQERIDAMIIMSGLLKSIERDQDSIRMLYEASDFAAKAFAQDSAYRAFVDVALANALFNETDPSTFQEATKRIERAISFFESSGDDFHAFWATRQLGHLLLAQGNPSGALELYTRAQSNMTLYLGKDHHETILCASYAAIAHLASNHDPEIFSQKLDTSISTLSTLLGKNHPAIQSILDTRARINQAAP